MNAKKMLISSYGKKWISIEYAITVFTNLRFDGFYLKLKKCKILYVTVWKFQNPTTQILREIKFRELGSS